MGCLVSIFNVGINSNSFPWPLDFVHETFPQNLLRRPPDAIDEAIWQSQWAWPEDVIRPQKLFYSTK